MPGEDADRQVTIPKKKHVHLVAEAALALRKRLEEEARIVAESLRIVLRDERLRLRESPMLDVDIAQRPRKLLRPIKAPDPLRKGHARDSGPNDLRVVRHFRLRGHRHA